MGPRLYPKSMFDLCIIAVLSVILASCGGLTAGSAKSVNRRAAINGGIQHSPDPGPVPGAPGGADSQAVSCKTSGDQFKTNVTPILDGKCLACHRAGGSGAGSLTLKGPNPSTAEAAVNVELLKKMLDTENVDNSKLLLMVANKDDRHAGGMVLEPGSVDFGTLKTWAASDVACTLESVPTNLSRLSGEAITMRLQALFPQASAAIISASTFDQFAARSINRAVAHPSRQFSTVVEIVMRGKANALCRYYVDDTDDKSTLFKLDSNLLLAGETAPNDVADKIALAAARNAWLYPYKVDSTETKLLADLYREAVAVGADNKAAKKAVCVAALMAPQFLFGNAGETDQIRRMALEVGRRLPTMSDYEDYHAALDKGAYLKFYVAKLQNTTTGYADSVKDWHRDWFGLRGFINLGVLAMKPAVRTPFGGISGGSVVGSWAYEELPSDSSGFAAPVRAMELLRRANTRVHTFSELCARGKEQEFDPRTTRILWQQFNPESSAWETIGGWDKSSGQWVKTPGSITLADDSKRTTSVDDVVEMRLSEDGLSNYVSGNLKDTPLDHFDSKYLSPKDRPRRVRRFSPSGEQNGYSTVKLWWSNEEVKVCNTVSRFPATCYYRPASAANFPTGRIANWNAGSGGVRPEFGPDLRDSLATPPVLDSFRCGKPNAAEILTVGSSGYSEDVAYPRGVPGDDLNDLAVNAADFYSANGTSLEDKAIGRLVEDVANEPMNLLDDILSKNKDYRLILTAPYTIGRTELELLYRNQAYNLPVYMNNVRPQASSLHLIAANTFRPIPIRYLFKSESKELLPNITGADKTYLATEFQRGSIPPKQMSGVLTQAAFLGPVSVGGGKPRSIAARMIQRLLCGLPSEFLPDLDANARRLHRNFIPTYERDSVKHLDPKAGCYGCHIVMDPLASALSADFAEDVNRSSTGEMKFAGILNNRGGTYGVRTGYEQGTGALFGKKVTGIAEVARVLADSKQFARCTVKTAFKNIFGREPEGDDNRLIDTVAKSFSTKLQYNYDGMVSELMTSPIYQRSN